MGLTQRRVIFVAKAVVKRQARMDPPFILSVPDVISVSATAGRSPLLNTLSALSSPRYCT